MNEDVITREQLAVLLNTLEKLVEVVKDLNERVEQLERWKLIGR